MTSKELWDKLSKEYTIENNIIKPNNLTIKGKKILYVQKNGDKYKVVLSSNKKKIRSINYSIYGTPEESLTYKFALANRRDFGLVEYVTDKDYVVNSYHVDPRENISWDEKLRIEGKYLALSSGGAVSYVETADLIGNPEAVETIIKFIHKNILYAEINRKIGVCYKCGFVGDIPLLKTEGGEFMFKCPNCGNTDDSLMDITARICGYLGKVNSGNTNKGRLDDIFNRILHTDCFTDYFL